MRIMKKIPRFLYSFIIILMLVFSSATVSEATEVEATTEDSKVTEGTDTTGNNIFGVELSTDDDSTMSGAIQIVIVLTILALCPSILILLTSFTRIIMNQRKMIQKTHK